MSIADRFDKILDSYKYDNPNNLLFPQCITIFMTYLFIEITH
jgi:hypothetical protein